jgi:hypothetical protein
MSALFATPFALFATKFAHFAVMFALFAMTAATVGVCKERIAKSLGVGVAS